ncbi:MAG TPA: tRNA (adenosine(37)-N6)-threonylcarbamoyltransferase complex ATPase subunit type 1 TsaE [Galbitalea sp.]|jgi:tRNA A37 threonylcarbamoyladenosine biosynthesis protein TsaE|nr:tRNA (adenosine(37)-N6)-threonylcarbamoyltransferase complex ATPase subunit type 1 TsaE [Galbitalea sp.]
MTETTATELGVPTPDAMEQLGALIARQLRAGDVVLLNGELGAGKTTLTRGIGAELGVRGAVTSPTFVLARTHPRAPQALQEPREPPHGPRDAPLVHVDAYRLGSAVELDDLDIDYAGSIVVVEWGAGLLDGLTEDWLEVDIVRPTGSEASTDELIEPRTVTITGHGVRWKDLGWVGASRD